MFVRRKVAKGHTYHQLVEGYRTPDGKVRQRVLASLGRAGADAAPRTVAAALADILDDLTRRTRETPRTLRRRATKLENDAKSFRGSDPSHPCHRRWERRAAELERQAAGWRRSADELARRIERIEALQRRHAAAVVPTTVAGEGVLSVRAEVVKGRVRYQVVEGYRDGAGQVRQRAVLDLGPRFPTVAAALAAARAAVPDRGMRQEQEAAQYERVAERMRRDRIPAWWESEAEELEKRAAALRSRFPAQERVELLESIQRRLAAAAAVVPTAGRRRTPPAASPGPASTP